MEKVKAFTRKRALTVILVLAIAIFLLVLVRWLVAYNNHNTGLSTLEGRKSFLSELGWEIDPDSEEFKSVVMPDSLDDVLSDYNKMQLSQGWDLNKHLGEKCSQYTYTVTNYPDCSEPVYITIYIQGSRAIAGDIHTNSLSGFMHGIKKSAEA
ncbi:MAG: DUF4830 domain-containing protein [Candidatus Limivicinus sp.]